jgi:mono/diheme cytochrome c family protein
MRNAVAARGMLDRRFGRCAMGASHVVATALALAGLGGFIAGAAASSPHGQAGAQPAGPVKTVPGSTIYMQYCASCHGTSGKGDGTVAPHLRRRPTDLTKITTQNKGVFPADQLARVIDGRETTRTHGNPDMPVWGDAFKKTADGGDDDIVKLRIREVVRYIESIQERPAGGASPPK